MMYDARYYSRFNYVIQGFSPDNTPTRVCNLIVTVNVYEFNGIHNPLNPPFLRGNTGAPPVGVSTKFPLRKGGKGVVFCIYFERPNCYHFHAPTRVQCLQLNPTFYIFNLVTDCI